MRSNIHYNVSIKTYIKKDMKSYINPFEPPNLND